MSESYPSLPRRPPSQGDVSSLGAILRRRAAEEGDRPAYTFLVDGEVEGPRLTWGELDTRARAVAAALAEGGAANAAAGDRGRALLLYPPGLDFVAAFFGCLYAGVAAVPAYPPRSKRSLPRLGAVAADAGAGVALTVAESRDKFAALASAVPDLAGVRWLATDQAPAGAGAADTWRDPGVGPDDLAFLQYTSGSTAAPKGVRVHHRHLLHNEALIRDAFGQSPESVVVGWLPLYHDMGLIGTVLQPLYSGSRCILMSPLAFLQRPRRWLAAISRYRATTSGGPNFAYELCVRKVREEERAGLDLASWEVAFNGAEPVRAETLDRFAAAFGPSGFRREAFLPCYGLAEATLFVSGAGRTAAPAVAAFSAAGLERGVAEPVAAADPGDDEENAGARRLVGCGRPPAGQQVVVVDPESRRPRAEGEVGEIWVAGPSVAGGYWRRPEATAETFAAALAEPLADGFAGPFLRTGDLGFSAGGELFVTGRRKDLIIVRGRNHYPQDLELTAESGHPALRPGCGAAFAVEAAGEERVALVQEVEREAARSLDGAAVAEAVRRAVAEGHELEVWAVALLAPGQVPKTSSGKVRRHACREAFLAGTFTELYRSTLGEGGGEDAAGAAGAEAEAPPPPVEALRAASPAERRRRLEPYLRAEVARALRTTPEALAALAPTAGDRALALDSLAAMELRGRVEEALGVELPLGELLEAPSFTGLLETAVAAVGAGGESGTGPASAPPPAAAGEPPAEFPLSYGQRALWFLQRLAPGSSAYHLHFAARLGPKVDEAALERALARLVARHPSLRTVYDLRDGRPVQRVLAPAEAAVPLERVAPAAGDGDGDLAGAALARRLAAAAAEPFDLAAAPPLRLRLYAGDGGGRVLLLAVHHLAVDLWSLMVLAEELGRLYAAERAGGDAGLAPPALACADFVRWQEELLGSPAGEASWRFWQERLAGEPPTLDLPTDRPRPPVASFAGGARPFRLGGGLAARVRERAAALGVTPFAFCLAAFQTLLHRWSGQRELVVGTPAAGRTRPRLGGLVGYLVNPLPVRIDLGGGPTFAALAGRVREAVVAALDHQDFPFPLLVERLAPQRDPSRSPLFQAFFAYEQPHRLPGADLAGFVLGEAGSRLELGGGLALESVPVEERAAQFDLELVMVEGGGGLAGTLRYAADLFDAATAERMARQLQALLAAAVADPGRRLAELPLLAAAERHQLVVEWNDTGVGWEAAAGAFRPVHERISAQAARTPDRVAVAGGGEALTYGALAAAASRLAAGLRRLGVGSGDRVAVALERAPRLVAALLGVLEAGAAYVPVDPGYPRERLALMLEDSGAAVLLTEAALVDALPPSAAAVVRLDTDDLGLAAIGAAGARGAEKSNAAGASAARGAKGSETAYVIYTSGSTGRPKGVVVPHGALVNFLATMAEAPGLAAGDVLLAVTSLSFDISALELYLPLLVGGRVELATRAEAADGPRLAARLAESGATVMQATPATWRLLVETGWRGDPALAVLCGGEGLPGSLAAELGRRAAAVWNLYGPTETTVWSARHQVIERLTPLAPSAASDLARLTPLAPSATMSLEPVAAMAPIGWPIANTGIYLLDGRFGPVPLGAVGELWIGGHGLARGYHGRPALTAERFLPDPFAAAGAAVGGPGARMYRTGDLARRRADGTLEFLGRVDHQVKVRGFRIELGEVEAALVAHPAVGQAVVVAREDRRGDRRLVGYLVAAGEGGAAPPAADDLATWVHARLPEYMVPSAFVVLDRFPLTPNGKVDRRALPAPAPERAEAGEGGAPRSELESAIAAVWREVLGVDRVGVDDNFFDLGGHSLLASQVHARLVDRLGLALTLVDLFRHPTVGALARFAGGGAGASAADAGRRRAEARRRARGGGRPAGDGGDGRDGAVAIVGLAGRFPGAADAGELWANLRAGVESIRALTDDELATAGVAPELLADPRYVRRAAPLAGADLFDAGYFDLNPREAELLDPQQRVFLEVAVEALEDAGCDPGRFPGAIGVFAGAGINAYLIHELAGAAAEPAAAYQVMIGNDKDFLATRVSYKLDLRGPSVAVGTACSTSLVAVHLACQSLLAGECDAAVAGGVSIAVPTGAGYLYQEGMILSPDGRCRAFDAGARGTVRGSGAGAVVLKRLADAVAAGDRVRAVVLGSAINNDGAAKVGYTAPSVERQAAVVAEALAAAGVAAETISYVEAHGTGTELGDPIEVAALAEAFRAGGDRTDGSAARRDGPCRLGSVKTNLGHLDAAAGVAGLIKTALALEHGEIPASLHFREPNPEIDFAAGPFAVADRLLPWPPGEAPRRAGVSSFGIGGTNAHVVVEEAPRAAEGARPSRPWQLLTLSARSPEALERSAAAFAGRLAGDSGLDLADAAYTLSTGRRAHEHRRIVVARDRADAAAALADPTRTLGGVVRGGRPEVAFLFPGQGAQHLGMGRELAAAEPVFRRELERAAAALAPHLGVDLRELLAGDAADGDEAARRLDDTAFAQPALFAVEVALARQWREWGIEPAAMLGHSLGEYTAACLAGVFSFEEGLALVAARGRLMQALPRGAMLALPLAAEDVEPLLAEAGGVLALAAVNAPGSCVVSGPTPEIEALARRLAGQGVEGRRLATSHAFHSPMMEPALTPFLTELARVALKPPRIPFLSNLTGTWIRAEEATDPGYWARHLRTTVRFADGLGELLRTPGRVLLEVGPGRTLAGLARRHPGRRPEQPVVASFGHPRDPGPEPAHLLTALGRLWLAGAPFDADGFWRGEERRKVALPTYPFERRRYWAEGRHAAPAATRSRGTAAAAVAPPPVGRRPDPADWFYLPSWRRTLPPAPPAADAGADGPWLLLADAGGFAAVLADRLAASGREAIVVRAGAGFDRRGPGEFMVDPRRREDFVRLLAAVGRPAALIHLWGLDGGTAAADTAAYGEPGEAAGDGPGAPFFGLLHALQALVAAPPGGAGAAAGPAPIEVAAVAGGLVEMVEAAGEGPPRPAAAALAGLCRVAPQEHPRLRCRAIDVGALPPPGRRRGRLAELLLAEIAAAPVERTVAYRGEGRWVPSYEPVAAGAPADGADPPLRRGGVYLITGGFGGIGRTLARHLTGELAAKLVLVGRTPLPPWEAWPGLVAGDSGTAGDSADPDSAAVARVRFVQELEAAGGEVLAVSADVADEAAMAAAVGAARERFGTLHGVVHAAGTAGLAAARALADTGAAEVAAHWRAKVEGARVLDRVLGGDDLDFCLHFSSLSAVLGGLGYGAYAAANLGLDAFVAARNRERPHPWLTVDWDGWRPAAEAAAAGRGAAAGETWELALSPEEGVAAFRRALGLAAAGRLVVSTADLGARLARWVDVAAGLRPGESPAGAAAAADAGLDQAADTRLGWRGEGHPRPDLANPYVAPGGEIERRVAAVWQELLGIERVGLYDNFFELGGTSLLGVQVVAEVNRRFGVEVPTVGLYEGPTVKALAAIVAVAGGRGEAGAGPGAARREAALAGSEDRGDRRRELAERRRAARAAGGRGA